MDADCDILIAHPHKHHVLELAAGCMASGAKTNLTLPFYRKGFLKLIALLPGASGKKARGYFHPLIPDNQVRVPLISALDKLSFGAKDSAAMAARFDLLVANHLQKARIRPRWVLTMQDYMPRTMETANRLGLKTWSDQISNQTESAVSRINEQYRIHGLPGRMQHDETVNSHVLAHADLVTAPSRYVHEGVASRVKNKAALHVIPYGVNLELFGKGKRQTRPLIVARINSLRKGGAIFFQALDILGSRVGEAFPQGIEVVSLGRLDEDMRGFLHGRPIPSVFRFHDEDIPHLSVPELFTQTCMLVMPSLSEGMSLVCGEALAAGVPVIATPYCGFDYIQAGVNGDMVEPEPDALAQAMANLLSRMGDPGLTEACRQSAAALDWANYRQRITAIAAGL